MEGELGMVMRRGGRGPVEDELVGAAMQISELRQRAKHLQQALAEKEEECSR